MVYLNCYGEIIVMKKKETLQEKLARRKYKIPNRLIYSLLSTCVVKWFLQPKYNVH